MTSHANHPFQRPWTLTGAVGALVIITGIIKWFHHYGQKLATIGITIIILTTIQWWDIVREGLHTKRLTKGLRWGIILFIDIIVYLGSLFWSRFVLPVLFFFVRFVYF
jgi:hypothetical protein